MSDIGLYRADGPETSYEGAKSVANRSRLQRERILAIVQDYGPIIDADIEAKYRELHGTIVRGSVNARRNELVYEGKVDDSGLRGPSPDSEVQCIRWGLVANISAEQMRRNIARRSGPRAAIEFALSQPGTAALEFLKLWKASDWDGIKTNFSEFITRSQICAR